MNLSDTLKFVEGATRPETLFGKDADKVDAEYKRLVKMVHPDIVPSAMRDRATAAFMKLTELHRRAGSKSPVTTLGKWEVMGTIGAGDIADLYLGKDAAIKIARSPRDSDLMEREQFSLEFIHAWPEGAEFKKYIPRVLDKFEASGRRATVLSLCENQLGLHEIMSRVPILEFRHAVWMVNRSLSALGYVHRRGIIHGAVLPPHLMFGPANHSLSLIDWCYSVTMESKDKIPAKVKDWASAYAPEVGRKMIPSPATDIYMLFSSLRAVGIKPPRRFEPIFEWCLADSPLSRPSDAWELQDRWRAVAEQEYGPSKFVELVIPTN